MRKRRFSLWGVSIFLMMFFTALSRSMCAGLSRINFELI